MGVISLVLVFLDVSKGPLCVPRVTCALRPQRADCSSRALETTASLVALGGALKASSSPLIRVASIIAKRAIGERFVYYCTTLSLG